MQRLIIILGMAVMPSSVSATDFIIPDPVTYEWTVELLQNEIPRVDFVDTSIRDAIRLLGSSMHTPIEIKHDLPEDVLDKRVTWKLRKVSQLEVLSRIADVAGADILIGKRIVTLKKQLNKTKSNTPEMAKPRKASN